MMNTTIARAESDDEIAATYDVMSQLRPHVIREEYVATIRRLQANEQYQLTTLLADAEIVCVAGHRLSESLAWGRYLYIDDLVSAESARSAGHGATLFRWLIEHARASGCRAVHLDSGVQRHDAHRFYLRERMDIVFYHFRHDL
jgi:GNAT superfamily N-acetyltransferase